MRTDYSYLRTPPQLYQIQPNPQEAFKQNNGRNRRELFYNLQYNQYQLNEIQKFKEYALKKGTKIDCNIQNICRYLHAYEFDYDNCLSKIREFLQWNHDKQISSITPNAYKILSEGFIYTYGRDKKNRPIIIMDLTKLDFDKYSTQDYYSATNAVLNIVIQQRFVKGVIQTYCWMINMGGQNITLSIDKVKTIMTKLSIIYSMLLGHMLIINVGRIVKILYNTARKFIHPQTVRKITILDCSQVGEIKQIITENNLQQKFGGRETDLKKYWPPSAPQSNQVNKTHFYDMRKMDQSDSESYYSVDAKTLFIAYEQSQEQKVCCNRENCRLF